MEKERLDIRMVREGFAPSREKAKALIRNGQVYCNGSRADKAGLLIAPETVVTVEGIVFPYVSRGGFKLEKALAEFSISLAGAICMDAGASTGGFTDCMLQNQAAKVYAVDVGSDQLDPKLRQDQRVVTLEKTNVRYLSEEIIPELCDFASVDVSFISLTKVLMSIAGRLQPNGEIVCLVKPQFEAGRPQIGKRGVVKDAAVHQKVLQYITSWCIEQGFRIRGLTFSPVRGPEGNIEYLLYISKTQGGSLPDMEQYIMNTVKRSHEEL